MFGNFQLTSLAVIPVLGFLIFIHELGHFLAAKWMGVRVHEFGFGYPPRMFKLFEHDGVEYTINWLPFGGFVRMAGESDDFDAEGSLPSVAPWRRIIVMAAGPFMNLLTAVVIFAILMMAGIPQFVGDQAALPVQIVGVDPESPAAQAGLQANDVILSIAGQEVIGLNEVSAALQANAGQMVDVVVRRGDEDVTVSLRPRLPEEIPAGRGAAGIQITAYVSDADIELVKYGPIEALIGGVKQTWSMIVLMIGGLVTLLRGLLLPDVPSPEGGVGGLVAIGRITAEIAQQGWRDLFNLTAFLSINLAILNMLPIPALDGGRIMFALIEMISKRRIPPEKEALVHFAGFAVLIALMAIVTFVDISNWVAGKPALPGG
ncbi:MAG TPA: site-2 protease family protein [Caldilineae bacterium]|nr:site-2 protease family protein [Caldilineae bacterium]